mmetsp:Transcript_647/g.526  ORF Transcript_647/g.526 Transcript_647/m.526 type:complete len:86 (+) Transcript_647:3-260(+)
MRLAEEKRRLEGPDVAYKDLVDGEQLFGHTFIQSQVKSLGRTFTKVTHLDATMKDQKVWIRARCQNTLAPSPASISASVLSKSSN